jgi:hypothetical protein
MVRATEFERLSVLVGSECADLVRIRVGKSLCANGCTRFFSVFSGVGLSSFVWQFLVGCSA